MAAPLASVLPMKVTTLCCVEEVTRKASTAWSQRLKAPGGSATGFILNATEENTIEDTIAEVEKNIGPIEVVVFNLGAQIGDRPLAATTYKMFVTGLANGNVWALSRRIGCLPAYG